MRFKKISNRSRHGHASSEMFIEQKDEGGSMEVVNRNCMLTPRSESLVKEPKMTKPVVFSQLSTVFTLWHKKICSGQEVGMKPRISEILARLPLLGHITEPMIVFSDVEGNLAYAVDIDEAMRTKRMRKYRIQAKKSLILNSMPHLPSIGKG